MASKPQPVAVETPDDNQTEYEQKNVHEVYEVIATHFSDTRYKVCFFLRGSVTFFLTYNSQVYSLGQSLRIF